MICLDICDVSCAVTEWNSMELDRKEVLTSPTKFVFFRADPSTKMATLASVLLRDFLLLLCKPEIEIDKTLACGL